MPNICENTLTVTGPPEAVAAFVKKARGMAQEFAPAPLCARLPPEEQALCFHALVPIPAEALALRYDGEPYQGLMGQDWERALWGIKWGAHGSTLVDSLSAAGGAVYAYETPTGPAEKFFETVSKDFPTLRFEVSFDVEEGESVGRFVAQAGKVEEAWPVWINVDSTLGIVPSEVKARVWRVTSCDALHSLELTFAPWCLFEDDPFSGISRSHLDFVEALTEAGDNVKFYVKRRTVYTGATYLFFTSGQRLYMNTSSTEHYPGGHGLRAHAHRLWPQQTKAGCKP